MAPLITHLVVGERVFAHLHGFDPSGYGSFLLGCLLVDVHGFSDVDRRRTHFVGRLEEDGEDAFRKSCASFLNQLNIVLLRPWGELGEGERAFVTGYLCHLAADEDWKRFGWNVMHEFKVPSLADLPVPGDVFLTAFDVLSHQMYQSFPAVVAALGGVSVPDVLAHVPHRAFQRMWDVVREYVTGRATPEAYFEMLRRNGATDAEMREVLRQHAVHLERATTWVHDLGGVEPRVYASVERSLELLPRLWA